MGVRAVNKAKMSLASCLDPSKKSLANRKMATTSWKITSMSCWEPVKNALMNCWEPVKNSSKTVKNAMFADTILACRSARVGAGGNLEACSGAQAC